MMIHTSLGIGSSGGRLSSGEGCMVCLVGRTAAERGGLGGTLVGGRRGRGGLPGGTVGSIL